MGLKQVDERSVKEKELKLETNRKIKEKTEKALNEGREKQKKEMIQKYRWNARERIKKTEVVAKSDSVWESAKGERVEKVKWEKIMKHKYALWKKEQEDKRKRELAMKRGTREEGRDLQKELRTKKEESVKKIKEKKKKVERRDKAEQ